MKPSRQAWTFTARILGAATIFCLVVPAQAGGQQGASDARAKQWIEGAVATELAADQNDHTNWTYLDHDKTDDKDAVYEVIETPNGALRRMVERNGQPVADADKARETSRITTFVHDPDAQAKERKAGEHDDAQARAMLKMLPVAFVWTVKSETPELTTLAFRPNPDFHPPDMEARVMGTMAGELVIARADNRIRTLRGELTDDVKIGFGMLGKLRKGGTFDVERREVSPHHWQITETRVHIGGRALLFKTIGQQEDEVKMRWKPSTAGTLEEAAKELGAS